MAGPDHTITISGVNSHAMSSSTSTSTNTTIPIQDIPIPTSRQRIRYQTQAQAQAPTQAPAQTTAATIPIQHIPISRHQVRPQTPAQAELETQTRELAQIPLQAKVPAQYQTYPQVSSKTQTPAQAQYLAEHQALAQAQQQKQTQKHPQTTTAFIFHISTLIYNPRTSTSPSSIHTTGTNSNSNSDATWSLISVSDSGSISDSGYISSGSDSASFKDKCNKSHHPNPLRQHQIVNYLLPRPSAGETIAKLQAVGVPFVVVWEPSQSSTPGPGKEVREYEDDILDNESTSEEEVASTLTRVLGLKVPICPEKVVGRWTLLRSVAAQARGQQSQNCGNECQKEEKQEVMGTLVIGEDEERCREMARMLGFEASRVVNSEEVERMWERNKAVDEGKKGGEQEEEKVGKKEEQKDQPKDQRREQDLTPKQNQTKRQHLKPAKPTLKLRSRLSCPFDDMKFVERLCFSPEDKIDEESTDSDGNVSERQFEPKEKKEEANKGDQIESPPTPTSPSTPSTPDTVQGQYIPVKHRERTVAYVPVSPTSSTSSKEDFDPVTRITSIIFFSPPSAKTWNRDVRVVSKLCQSQGEETPRLYIVQKPGELGRGSPSLASSSSSASASPSPTFSTSPSESSLDTLTSTASTVFSKASSTSTTESAPSRRQFKLTVSRTTSDWIRDVTIHWRASNPNLSEKAKLPYYIIDPLTCGLQVLEIGRQRAQSTIWARANLPVHLRQTLHLETLYVVDSGEKPSQLFRNLDKACDNKGKHSATSYTDPDALFQRYLSSLGVEVIPAKRCKRIWMCNVYEVGKRLEKLGVHGAHMVDNNLEPVDDSQQQISEEVQDTSAPQHTTQTHQRRTSWLRQLITRGQPRSKARSPGVGGQGQTRRPSTSSFNKSRSNHADYSNHSTTNITINSTNVPPTHIAPNVPGIPRSMTTPITNISPNTPNTFHDINTTPNPSTTRYTPSATAKFYSPSALNMVTRTRSQMARDINAVTAFCHSNNIECGIKYAINHEYWECVDQGLRPVWPIGEPGERWTREGRGGSGYGDRI